MPFKEVVAAGVYLVREALRSPNYVPSVSGWTINRDGSAEFNLVTIRGGVIVGGPPPDASVVIDPDGNNFANGPIIALYSGQTGETGPGGLANFQAAAASGGPALSLVSSLMNNGQLLFVIHGPDSADAAPFKYGYFSFESNGQTAAGSTTLGPLIATDPDMSVRIQSSKLTTLASDYDPLMIGTPGGNNLAFDVESMQARLNGAASTLFINPDGGTINLRNVSGAGGGVQIVGSSLQGVASNAAATLVLQPSGGGVDATTGNLSANQLLATANTITGNLAGTNTVLNGNQLYARNGASANGILYLNNASTNSTVIGGGVTITAAGAGAFSGNVTANGSTYGAGITTAGGTQIGTVIILAGGDFNTSANPNTTGTAANCTFINTAGTSWQIRRFTSSRKQKENITDLVMDPSLILALTPRTFQRNDETKSVPDAESETGWTDVRIPVEDAPWRVGFVAEEAEALGLEEFVERDDAGEVIGFQYGLFVTAQQVVLRQHEARIAALEATIEELRSRK